MDIIKALHARLNKIPPRRAMAYRSCILFGAVIVFVFVLTIVNLARIQLVHGDEYKIKAEQNQLSDTTITPERGIIYDANGTVLAKSAFVWKLEADIRPVMLKLDSDFDGLDIEAFKNDLCQKLSAIIDIEPEKIREMIDSSENGVIKIKGQIELDEKNEISAFLKEEFKYKGIAKDKKGNEIRIDKSIYYASTLGIKSDIKRYYPYGSLAAHVLGFTGTDDQGITGLEDTYNSILTGIPGRILTAKNGANQLSEDPYQTMYDAKQGTSLVLTIDETIQRFLEKSLEQAYVESKGKGAYGVVMDVETGAILGMANVESYDLNNPYHLSDEEKEAVEALETDGEKAAKRSNFYNAHWRNAVISDTYDPGSVFKIITASAAIEENAVDTETFNYYCTGSIKVKDRVYRCHKRDGHGSEDLEKGLMNSCNPLFITVGQKLGKEKFFEYFEAFGFTEKTGIDLNGEGAPVAGKGNWYLPLEEMGLVELSSYSFGQSFSVTPIQMVTAISAIANGGYLMKPYVVAKQLDENGNVIKETKPVVRRQVISRETASIVGSMMESVVTNGTGTKGYVSGYRVAGKTGTSQKLRDIGHYVASFGCFAPAENAKIAVLIVVNDPQGQINGSQVCAPVAARVVEKTLEYLGVEKQYSKEELEKLDKNTPNLVGESIGEAITSLESEGFTVKVVGSGEIVLSQMPRYNQTLPQNGIVVLYTEDTSEKLTSTVPDLLNMTVSQANKYAHAEGLNMEVSGNVLDMSGLVSYEQDIEPGTEVEYGSTVKVYFKSSVDLNDFAG